MRQLQYNVDFFLSYAFCYNLIFFYYVSLHLGNKGVWYDKQHIESDLDGKPAKNFSGVCCVVEVTSI